MRKWLLYLFITLATAALMMLVVFLIYNVTAEPAPALSGEEYSTYLEYKKHYDLNNGTKLLVASRYGIGYGITGLSTRPLQQLAMSGDKFAYAVLPFAVPYNRGGISRDEFFEMAAAEGEVVGLTLWGTTLIERGHFDEGEAYIAEAAEQDYIVAYSQLIRHYHANNSFDQMCTYARDGYGRFGIEVLSGTMLSESKRLEEIYKRCGIFGKVEEGQSLALSILDAEGSYEARLLKAFYLTQKKEYQEAFAMYRELSQSGVKRVSGNAKYCLGKMYMKGVGVGQNEEVGEVLLKESLEMGQVLAVEQPLSGFADLPESDMHIDFLGNNCGSI